MDKLKEEYEILKKRREEDDNEIVDDLSTVYSNSMCPRFEYLERTIKNDLDPIEIKHNVIIKRYYRSVAGRQEERREDIRNINALHRTVEFLLKLDINYNSY
ncbi:hypothetical protein A0H76_2562 [Hepatospora eriocheir]|uniref:SAC3/GANP/THP3 conserved domain-containing protein n=1 Tax=Hepatospora eriocheir TaxID=1081669 RepID=A0A1X0QJV1_9MICR|nr:hypothetical protein A0H76_2562 [Hepatospora eriocheir]